jgi:two-component sensor histidine kinase
MEDTRLIFPSPSLRSILLIALRNPILPTLPILLVNNIAVLLVFVPESHSLLNLVLICCLQLISTLLIIKLVTFTYKKFMGSRFQWSIGPQILIIIYLLLKLNKYFMQALVSNNFSELLAQRFFLNFVWILYLMFFTSFLANMLENGSAIQAFVLQLIASDKVDELLVHEETLRVKHDIARYLHGNLQSRIMSLGLTMNMNVTKNQESMDSAMTIASSLLDSPFGEYLDTQERSLDDEVFYYVAKWDGLLEIKTEISEHTIVLTAVQKRAIGSALEEALANALRHGFAKSVQIHIFQEGVDLIVQVLDDGIGPRKSEAGLGSRLYDQISAKGWSLQHRINDEGTVLELRL